MRNSLKSHRTNIKRSSGYDENNIFLVNLIKMGNILKVKVYERYINAIFFVRPRFGSENSV